MRAMISAFLSLELVLFDFGRETFFDKGFVICLMRIDNLCKGYASVALLGRATLSVSA